MERRDQNRINQANAEKQADGFWTQERVDELRTRATDGDSAHVIADALGTTRNAVIGKCRRQKITLVGWNNYLERVRGGGPSRRDKRALRRAERIREKIKKLDELRASLETHLAKLSEECPEVRVSRETSKRETAGVDA